MKSKKAKKFPKKPVIGIDIGGTTVNSIIIDTSGKIISQKQFPTYGKKGPDYVVKNIAKNVKALVSESGLLMKNIWRAGVGSPGPLDSKKGIIMGAVNLPGWKYVRLKKGLEKYLKIKTAVDNDANCAAYGEQWTGAAKRASDVVALTLGTGIGGGIILGGKLVRGANYNAAEIGHMSLDPRGRVCKCRAKGCFEQYASASAIAKSAKNMIKNGAKSRITELVNGKLNKIDSKVVFDAYVSGDKTARAVWDEFIYYLGAGVANIMNIFNPEMIVIGGGVINAGDKLFRPLRRAARKQAFKATYDAAKIVPAKLGQEAGAIGAAGLAIFEGDFYKL